MTDKCSICGTTVKPVQIYKIYYGKKDASATTNLALERQTTIKYSINPEPLSVSLCNSCINKERSSKRFFGIVFITLGLFLGWLFYSSLNNNDIARIILMICALSFFGGVGYFKLFIANEYDKEQIAINIAKKHFAKSEFNTFFTEAKYKSLNILPEFSQKTLDNEADEINNLIRIIEGYGLSEVHYIDGSANKALTAARRLSVIGKNEPRIALALINILSKLKSQRSAFQHPLAQLEADNLISIIFNMVTKNAIKGENMSSLTPLAVLIVANGQIPSRFECDVILDSIPELQGQFSVRPLGGDAPLPDQNDSKGTSQLAAVLVNIHYPQFMDEKITYRWKDGKLVVVVFKS